MAPSMDQDVTVHGPELAIPMSLGELPPEASRMIGRGVGRPASGCVAAVQPASMQLGPAAPPSGRGMGEAKFERPKRRARPTATPPIINDDDVTKCVVCREEFECREKVWGLQRGRIFHAVCRGRVVQSHVDRQIEGVPNTAPCAVCRGIELIAAAFRCALA
eukprot:9027021-Pyramimonas_sp.AAC.1